MSKYTPDFTWRGLVFKWDGRRHKYVNDQGWWVAHTKYDMFFFLKEGDPKLQRIEGEQRSGVCRWLAHCGIGGDAAERDSKIEALEGALEYALRYHHRRIAALRTLCFSHDCPAPEAGTDAGTSPEGRAAPQAATDGREDMKP